MGLCDEPARSILKTRVFGSIEESASGTAAQDNGDNNNDIECLAANLQRTVNFRDSLNRTLEYEVVLSQDKGDLDDDSGGGQRNGEDEELVAFVENDEEDKVNSDDSNEQSATDIDDAEEQSDDDLLEVHEVPESSEVEVLESSASKDGLPNCCAAGAFCGMEGTELFDKQHKCSSCDGFVHGIECAKEIDGKLRCNKCLESSQSCQKLRKTAMALVSGVLGSLTPKCNPWQIGQNYAQETHSTSVSGACCAAC